MTVDWVFISVSMFCCFHRPGLALESLQPFPHQLQKVLVADLQVVRGDDCLVDLARQELLPRRLGERRVGGLEKTALARNGFDAPLALQFGVGLGHCIAIDAQLLRQRAEGGKRLAFPQDARRRRVPDLVNQLEIDRFAGLEIDLEDHSCVMPLTVIGQYDSYRLRQGRFDWMRRYPPRVSSRMLAADARRRISAGQSTSPSLPRQLCA